MKRWLPLTNDHRRLAGTWVPHQESKSPLVPAPVMIMTGAIIIVRLLIGADHRHHDGDHHDRHVGGDDQQRGGRSLDADTIMTAATKHQ